MPRSSQQRTLSWYDEHQEHHIHSRRRRSDRRMGALAGITRGGCVFLICLTKNSMPICKKPSQVSSRSWQNSSRVSSTPHLAVISTKTIAPSPTLSALSSERVRQRQFTARLPSKCHREPTKHCLASETHSRPRCSLTSIPNWTARSTRCEHTLAKCGHSRTQGALKCSQPRPGHEELKSGLRQRRHSSFCARLSECE
jgi:hypothetical protein